MAGNNSVKFENDQMASDGVTFSSTLHKTTNLSRGDGTIQRSPKHLCTSDKPQNQLSHSKSNQGYLQCHYLTESLVTCTAIV